MNKWIFEHRHIEQQNKQLLNIKLLVVVVVVDEFLEYEDNSLRKNFSNNE